MKTKNIKLTLLFDFYGEILTEKQQELFDLYYNEDLSLAEISEHLNISRQGVRDGIKRAEEVLLKFEDVLGLAAKYGALSDGLTRIQTLADQIRKINETNYRNADIAAAAHEIQTLIDTLAD